MNTVRPQTFSHFAPHQIFSSKTCKIPSRVRATKSMLPTTSQTDSDGGVRAQRWVTATPEIDRKLLCDRTEEEIIGLLFGQRTETAPRHGQRTTRKFVDHCRRACLVSSCSRSPVCVLGTENSLGNFAYQIERKEGNSSR